MNIKKVSLTKPDKLQLEMGAEPSFLVTTDESDMATVVPNDPTNRHYHEIREWYESKKIKPFKFKFAKPE